MALSHKNSGNEYLVHTDANAALKNTAALWGNWWGKRDTQEKLASVERELTQLKTQYRTVQRHYNELYEKYEKTLKEGNELQWLKINHYFLHQHIENQSDSQAHKEKITIAKQKAYDQVMSWKTNNNVDKEYLRELVINVQNYIQKAHHDAQDQFLFTWTGMIKGTNSLY